MIDPAEANETYRAASAIAAFDAIQVAFAALVNGEQAPACDAIEFSTGTLQPTEMPSCPPGFHAGHYSRLQEPLE
jgi:hypothetical protein